MTSVAPTQDRIAERCVPGLNVGRLHGLAPQVSGPHCWWSAQFAPFRATSALLQALAGRDATSCVGWSYLEVVKACIQVTAGAPEALRNIAKLGFDPSHFSGVITSGEVAHRQLEQRPTAFWQQLGQRWACCCSRINVVILVASY